MRLEDVAAEVRPRGSWEAVDLGVALTRRYFPRIAIAWIVTVWPLWALLLVATNWVPVGLVLFVIWWLKPLYGRIPLFILSRGMFGAVPTLGQVVRAWPGMLIKRVGRALFAERLSQQRGLLLPLTMLEDLAGSFRKQRARVISAHSGSTASQLGLLCAAYELVMLFSVFALVQMLIPEGLTDDFFELAFEAGLVGEFPAALLWTLIGCWLFSISLIEIFYIGGSFGLYLNCRTQTEGWDVEMTFRRMARRLGGVISVVACFAMFAAGARAQDIEAGTEHESVAAEKSVKHEEIKRVLSDEDFKVHTVKRRVPKAEEIKFSGGAGLEVLGKVLFWLVAIGAVGALIYWIAKNLPSLRRGGGSAAAKLKPIGPRTLMGMDVGPESLPDDVLGAARARWAKGDAHGALSLLYRGALSWLVNSASLPLRDSDTEGDCVRLARKLPQPEMVGYFAALTASWVKIAYAERQPAEDEMQSLFSGWQFGGKGGE